MDSINWHTFFFLLFALVACAFSVGVVVSGNIVRMAFYLLVALGATAGLFFLAGAPFVGAMQLLIYVGGTLVLLIFGVMLTAQGPFVRMKTSGGEWVISAVVGGALLFVLVQAAFSVPQWAGNSEAEHARALTHARNGFPARLEIHAVKPGTELVGVQVNFHSGGGETVRVEYSSPKLAVYLPERGATAEQVAAAWSEQGSRITETFAARLPEGSNGSGQVTTEDWAQLAIRGPRGETPPARLGLALLGYGEGENSKGGYLLPFEIISIHLLVVLIAAAYLARTKKRVKTTEVSP